jgi:O-antigen/teichoic acid export membrane protein
MLSRLLKNTVVSGLAYTATAVVNLALVPVLIAAYGLEAYGLLVIARLFLPSGFAVADFGLSETGTVVVARGRASGGWDAAGRQLTLLLTLSLAVAVTIGLLLVTTRTLLASHLHVAQSFHDDFVTLVGVTAGSLLLFYPALLFEGIVKGYERYTLLRAVEVLATLTYAIGALAAIRADYSYVAVAYSFLAANAAKYLVLAWCAAATFRGISFRRAWADNGARNTVRSRSALMMHNKILGTLQTQLPALAVGLIVGPAGVATYDVVTRIPRAVKSVLALLTSALMPVAARLDERGDQGRLRAMGTAGFSFIPLIIFPTVLGGAVFSPDLLRIWLGAPLVHLWPWLAVMFLIPALNTLLSFGQTMMQVRTDFLARSNRLATVQIVGQYVLSFVLVFWLRELAFIAGQVAAMLMTFPWQLRLLLREQDIRAADVRRLLARHAGLATTLGIAAVVVKGQTTIDAPGQLLVAYGTWCLAYVSGSYLLTFSQSERVRVHRLLRAAIGSGIHS